MNCSKSEQWPKETMNSSRVRNEISFLGINKCECCSFTGERGLNNLFLIFWLSLGHCLIWAGDKVFSSVRWRLASHKINYLCQGKIDIQKKEVFTAIRVVCFPVCWGVGNFSFVHFLWKGNSSSAETMFCVSRSVTTAPEQPVLNSWWWKRCSREARNACDWRHSFA